MIKASDPMPSIGGTAFNNFSAFFKMFGNNDPDKTNLSAGLPASYNKAYPQW